MILLHPDQLLREGHRNEHEQILAIGNPFRVIALPYVLFAWRAVVVGLGQSFPWFVQTRPTFFFYVLPRSCLMVLAVTWLARDASTRRSSANRTPGN